MTPRIIYAPNKRPRAFNDQPHVPNYAIVTSDDRHIRDAVVTERTEEYWRAFIVTGMTRQVDPFFADRSTLRHYGRRV